MIYKNYVLLLVVFFNHNIVYYNWLFIFMIIFIILMIRIMHVSPQHKHWPTGPAHFSDRRASMGQYIVSFTGPAGPPS